MRKILVCLLLSFTLLPVGYGQKLKGGMAVLEGLSKEAPLLTGKQAVYPITEPYLEYIVPYRLVQGNSIAVSPEWKLSAWQVEKSAGIPLNVENIRRVVLKESIQQSLEQLALRVLTEEPLYQISFFTKAKTDAVIFDLDGTLLDSLGAWEHSGTNFLRSQGIEPPEELDGQLAQLSLTDGALLIKGMYHLPYTVEEILEATLRPIKERYYTDIPAKSKVPQLLATLKKRGIKMAIATASDEDFARAALSRLGLLDYFEFIITCDEVGVGKQEPRVYNVAQQRLGVPKRRVVVVEDALHAVETAHKGGFHTIGVADVRQARHIEEIKQIVDVFVSFE